MSLFCRRRNSSENPIDLELKLQNKVLNQSLENKTKELSALQKNFQDLECQISKFNQDINLKYELKIKDKSSSIDILKNLMISLKELLKKNNVLEVTVSTKDEEISRIKKEIITLKQENERKLKLNENEIITLKQENERKLKLNENEIITLKQENERKLKLKENEIITLNQEHETLYQEYEIKLELKENEIMIMKQENESIYQEYEKKLESKDNEIISLKEEYEKNIQNLENQLKNQHEKIRLEQEANENSEESNYHGIININRFRDIKDINKGWIIEFPTQHEINKDIFEVVGRSNAFLTVTGAYDKGKTFLLNKICNSHFPSGKKVETKGISFKKTNIKGTEVTVIDSAGSHSPIKMSETIEEKRETEKRLRDIIFLLSDFFILVVNDYTVLDQEILEKLEKQIQGNKNKKHKEIIVVHNLKDVRDEVDQQFIWKRQVEGLYFEESKSSGIKRQELAQRQECEIDGKMIFYLKTEFSRHVMLVNDNTEFGAHYNNLVIKMITMWIQACCVNYNKRNFFDNFFEILSQNLNNSTHNSDKEYSIDENVFFHDKGLMVTKVENENNLRLACIDSVVNEINILSDFYEPPLDIIENDEFYIISIDVPGIQPFDYSIIENTVKFTLIRKRIYETGYKVSERPFGECLKSFKIPPKYNSDDPDTAFKDGVLTITFKKKEIKTRAIKYN